MGKICPLMSYRIVEKPKVECEKEKCQFWIKVLGRSAKTPGQIGVDAAYRNTEDGFIENCALVIDALRVGPHHGVPHIFE